MVRAHLFPPRKTPESYGSGVFVMLEIWGFVRNLFATSVPLQQAAKNISQPILPVLQHFETASPPLFGIIAAKRLLYTDLFGRPTGMANYTI